MGREARAKQIRMLTDGVTRVLAESGRLIEAGFEIHAKDFLSKDITPEERERHRETFMMGAQHCFGSMSFIDDGDEITDAVMRRMTLLHEELENYVRHFKRRHKVGDEVYPQEPVGPSN